MYNIDPKSSALNSFESPFMGISPQVRYLVLTYLDASSLFNTHACTEELKEFCGDIWERRGNKKLKEEIIDFFSRTIEKFDPDNDKPLIKKINDLIFKYNNKPVYNRKYFFSDAILECSKIVIDEKKSLYIAGFTFYSYDQKNQYYLTVVNSLVIQGNLHEAKNYAKRLTGWYEQTALYYLVRGYVNQPNVEKSIKIIDSMESGKDKDKACTLLIEHLVAIGDKTLAKEIYHKTSQRYMLGEALERAYKLLFKG